jgi:GH25 family lysozyme M1 (1,4-beta-N-acetylmuramidase)
MPLALDISNWGAGDPPVDLAADIVAQWKAYAVRRVVIGVSHKVDVARQQLTAVTEGGLEAEAYIYMYWGQDPAVQVGYASQACAGLPVRRLWVDFEDDKAPKNAPDKVKAWIYRCLDAAAAVGLPLGIYTAWWWWTVWADDTHDFCDYPLWVAAYDAKADLEFPPFGGWTNCALKQYAGTTDFCGYSADLDFYEEDDMADEQARKEIAVLRQINVVAAAAQRNEMGELVTLLRAFGVLDPNVKPLKPALTGE